MCGGKVIWYLAMGLSVIDFQRETKKRGNNEGCQPYDIVRGSQQKFKRGG